MRKPLGWLLFCLGILVLIIGTSIGLAAGGDWVGMVVRPMPSILIALVFILGGWLLAHPRMG